jgi:DNA modification methylase
MSRLQRATGLRFDAPALVDAEEAKPTRSALGQKDRGGAIPSNPIVKGNTESNSDYIRACSELGVKVRPARFPSALPEFYMKLLTEPGDLVLDPFAGSNTTGRVAEGLNRRWMSIDMEEAYVRASGVRFGFDPRSL